MIYPLRDYSKAWYRGDEMAAMFVAGNKVWERIVPFSPLSLFANGEQGAWFDPSDLTTMFQDAAGTIPAAYGQPVGLILDKSGNGNHATATARPTLGRMPVGGVRNLFIHTEDITPSRWVKSNVNDYTYGFPDPFGGNRATRWKPVFTTDPGGATRDASLYQTSVDGTIGKARFSLYVKPVRIVSRYPEPPDATTADRDVYLMLRNQQKGTAYFNLRTMAVEKEGNGIVSTGAVDVGGGWWRLWYTAENLAATSNGNTWISFTNRTSQTNFDPFPDGNEEVHFFGPMLEVGNDIDLSAPPPPYQRVGANRYDVTEEGQPELRYLEFDGVDDTLVSGVDSPGACGPFYAALVLQGLHLNGSASALAGILHYNSGVNYSGLGASLYNGETGLAKVYRRRRDPTDVVEGLSADGMVDLKPHVISGGDQAGKLFLGLDLERVKEADANVHTTVPGKFRLGGAGLAQRIFVAVWVSGNDVSSAEMENVERHLAIRTGLNT